MSLIILDGASPIGAQGSGFGAQTTQVLTASGGVYVLPQGRFVASCSAALNVQHQTSAGVWATTMQIPAGGGLEVSSDGTNVRVENAQASNETLDLIPIVAELAGGVS